MKEIVSVEQITGRIYFIRGQRVMLDRDLAELYGVETRRLKEQVRRNIERFPDDFMFELTKNEFEILRSQFAISSWGGSRYAPKDIKCLDNSKLKNAFSCAPSLVASASNYR